MDLLDLTVDGLADQAEMAGLARLLAGAEEGASEGKASSDSVSTGVAAEWPLLLGADAEEGPEGLPNVGNGSGAPSRPCLCRQL